MSDMSYYDVAPFSVRLKIVRTVRRLPQGVVAREIGIDPSSISRWEAGLPAPVKHVQALEKFFNLKFDGPEVEQALQLLG